jgi:homoserine O-acetyltransferase
MWARDRAKPRGEEREQPAVTGRLESDMMTARKTRLAILAGLIVVTAGLPVFAVPPPVEGDFVLKDFRFVSGETLPELRVHYRTFGRLERDARGTARNAVLVLHGTTGSGAQFVRQEFAGELFDPGQPLDATRFFIILPDGIGHGKTSKPSDGFHTRFPRYGYRDMMDALMPLACLPTQISGRNRVWRRVITDAIRGDPEWRGGEYLVQPPSLRTATEMLFFMGSNPVVRQTEMPTLEHSDEVLDAYVTRETKALDANDVLYAVEASHDYDPGPALGKISAPLVAVNSADDLINPPELEILEREIARVRHGRAVVLPFSQKTRGHGTHTLAALWKQYLTELLQASAERRPAAPAAP